MELKNYNAARVYKETSIKTADGGKIVVLLYEEIDKHLTEAIVLLQKEHKHHHYDKINYHITMSQSIITELMASLDKGKSEEIYENLMRLYLYFNEQLSKANMEKDAQIIIPIHTQIKELLETWRIAAQTAEGSIQQDKRTGLNISG